MEGGTMRRHALHELRLGSFADGQAVEPPDTALVGRFSTGQGHPGAEVDEIRRSFDAGHTLDVTGRKDDPVRNA
jgi:hypothetical protein